MGKDQIQNVLKLLDKKQFEEATNIINKLIQDNPGNNDYKNILSIIYLNQNKIQESIQILEDIIKIQPTFENAYTNLFTILDKKLTFSQSLHIYNQLVKNHPKNLKILNKFSDNLLKENKFSEAIKILNKIIIIEPNNSKYFYNLGCSYNALGELKLASTFFEKALKVNPQHINSKYNLTLNQLASLNFEKGWKNFELRKEVLKINEDILGIPKKDIWDGKNFNTPLVIHAEQGIGDEVLISSLFNELVKKNDNILISCDYRLLNLFKRSFPKINFFDRNNLYKVSKEYKHIFGFSLCQYLRPNIKSFKLNSHKWLFTNLKIDKKINSYFDKNSKIKIGVSWKSIGNYYQKRNISLSQLSEIFPKDKFEIINLQYGDIEQDKILLEREQKRKLLNFDNIDYKNNIDELSSLIINCDLVVSIGGFTAGLSGALGVPTWALIPNVVEWIWVNEPDKNSSIWFPTVKIFKQKDIGNWNYVFDLLRSEVMYKFKDIL